MCALLTLCSCVAQGPGRGAGCSLPFPPHPFTHGPAHRGQGVRYKGRLPGSLSHLPLHLPAIESTVEDQKDLLELHH